MGIGKNNREKSINRRPTRARAAAARQRQANSSSSWQSALKSEQRFLAVPERVVNGYPRKHKKPRQETEAAHQRRVVLQSTRTLPAHRCIKMRREENNNRKKKKPKQKTTNQPATNS